MERDVANHCRHCHKELDLVLVDLGEIPVANDFVDTVDRVEADPEVELKVMVCGDCRLAQTVDFKAAAELFRPDYAYFSSASTGWVEHARRYVEMMRERFALDGSSTHVELAANDGYLLQFSQAAGLNILGVEPCKSVADVAIAKGIPTRIEFFGQDYAKQLVDEGFAADVITANNVFAHVPDVNDFAAGMRELLKPEGVATIEVQHLLRLMQHNEFDTIYHEHFSYYSLLAAMRVFEGAGLRVFDVEELPTHGGSLRYFVCRAEASHPTTEAVGRVLKEEIDYGLDTDKAYTEFATHVAALRDAFRELLLGLKAGGKSIAAYGAPAKGTTLLNYCHLGRDVIDFTVDKAKAKQGKAIPGVRIPIMAPDKIAEAKPDYMVILPWNLKDEIMEEMSAASQWGGRFITAIPWPHVV